jgi:hypothetical protein
MSRHVMRDIVYKQFPPRVLARTGEMVTLQMGRGSGVKRGDKFDVFALGDDLKDPIHRQKPGTRGDFHRSGGDRPGDPDKSMAKVLEDYGIEAMQIIRPTERGRRGGLSRPAPFVARPEPLAACLLTSSTNNATHNNGQ